MSDENDLHKKFDVVEYSLKYPTRNGAPFETAISILIATSTFMFVLPLFALMGYLAKVRKSAFEGNDPPRFEGYRELVKIGSQSFISYLPILLLVFMFIVIASYVPFFVGFIGIPIIFTPVIGVQFARSLDYRDVYDGTLFDIVTDRLFMRFAGLYIFTTIIMISVSLILGLLSLGIGFILFIPLFIWYRAAFWGYAIRKMENRKTKIEEEIASEEGSDD